MILKTRIPADDDLKDALKNDLKDNKIHAWILGRIHNHYINVENDVPCQNIHFWPIALVRD
jgi:hypothetical protein